MKNLQITPYSMGKSKSLFRSRTRQGCRFSLLLFNIELVVLAKAVRKEKDTRSIQIAKEEIKLSLFEDDMILHKENTKYSTKKLLQ